MIPSPQTAPDQYLQKVGGTYLCPGSSSSYAGEIHRQNAHPSQPADGEAAPQRNLAKLKVVADHLRPSWRSFRPGPAPPLPPMMPSDGTFHLRPRRDEIREAHQ
jgi:hypothetical protein